MNKIYLMLIALLFTGNIVMAEIPLSFSVPKLGSNIKVDGNLSERAWDLAPVLPPAHFTEDFFVIDPNLRLRSLHDKNFIYFAFDIKRPKGYEKPHAVSKNELLEFAEDVVHFCFLINDKLYTVTVNCERINLKSAFAGKCLYKAKSTTLGWRGEIAIPIRINENKNIYFDFINDQGTPSPQRSNIAFRKKLTDKSGLWQLKPTVNKPVVSFYGSAEDKLQYRYINNTSHEFSVETQSFCKAVDKFNLQQNLDNAVKQTSVDSLIRYGIDGEAILPKGKLGSYSVVATFKANNKEIASGIFLFKKQVPFKVITTPYYLTTKRVELSCSMKPQSGGKVIRVEVRENDGRKTKLSEQNFNVNNLSEKIIYIDASNFKQEHDYLIICKLLSAKNQVLAKEEIILPRPKNPVWANNNIGKKAFVPPPWTPLEYDNNIIKVWGRKIPLNHNLLPEQIVSQGKKLLTKPVKFKLKINGKYVDFSQVKAKIERDVEGVTVSKEQDFGAFKAEVILRAEFDGYMWYDFKIIPRKKVDIESAMLELFPVKENSTLFNCSQRVSRTIPPKLPPSGALNKNIVTHFSPFVWLGNDKVGLQYFCESDRYWSLQNRQETLFLEPGKFKAVFVDKPFKTNQELNYSFGLMASPIKPMPPRGTFWSQNTIACQYGPGKIFDPQESLEDFKKGALRKWLQPEPPKGCFVNAANYRLGQCRLTTTYNWSPMFGSTHTEDPEFNRKFTTFIDATHKAVPKMKITPYCGWGINKDWSFYRWFGTEMTKRPFALSISNTMLHCPNSSFSDFFTYGVKYIVDKYHADGVYLDSTGNVSYCDRPGHGCGYINSKGERRGHYPIRKMRDLFKRIYKVTHGEVIDNGVIYLHGTEPRLPILSFADTYLCGEKLMNRVHSLKTINREEFRSLHIGEPWGIRSAVCWHFFKKYAKVRPNQILGFFLANGIFVKSYSSYLMLTKREAPSYAPNSRVNRHIYILMDEFSHRKDTTFYPYWNNSAYLNTGNVDILGSFFINENKEAMLILCNLENTDQTAHVKFTLPSGKKISSITDGMLKNNIAFTGENFKVNIGPQSYRIIIIK